MVLPIDSGQIQRWALILSSCTLEHRLESQVALSSLPLADTPLVVPPLEQSVLVLNFLDTLLDQPLRNYRDGSSRVIDGEKTPHQIKYDIPRPRGKCETAAETCQCWPCASSKQERQFTTGMMFSAGTQGYEARSGPVTYKFPDRITIWDIVHSRCAHPSSGVAGIIREHCSGICTSVIAGLCGWWEGHGCGVTRVRDELGGGRLGWMLLQEFADRVVVDIRFMTNAIQCLKMAVLGPNIMHHLEDTQLEEPDLVLKCPRKFSKESDHAMSADTKSEECSDWNMVSQLDVIKYEFPDWITLTAPIRESWQTKEDE
eukprot:g40269.t1